MREKPKPPPRRDQDLDELRCPVCGKLLAKMRLTPGSSVQIMCRPCRFLVLKECA